MKTIAALSISFLLPILCAAKGNSMNESKPVPHKMASQFTKSVLRNRIQFELNAEPSKIWELVGNLNRFPEYSSGLAKVETISGKDGKPTEYVCHFKPEPGSTEGIVSREKVLWYEKEKGYASKSAQADAFGFSNDLYLVTLDRKDGKTIVTFDFYYDAKDLGMMKTHLNQAFTDQATNLTSRFGGKILTSYVEK